MSVIKFEVPEEEGLPTLPWQLSDVRIIYHDPGLPVWSGAVESLSNCVSRVGYLVKDACEIRTQILVALGLSSR